MEFNITLNDEKVIKYANFLGFSNENIENGLDKNKDFVRTLEHDLSSVIDIALEE